MWGDTLFVVSESPVWICVTATFWLGSTTPQVYKIPGALLMFLSFYHHYNLHKARILSYHTHWLTKWICIKPANEASQNCERNGVTRMHDARVTIRISSPNLGALGTLVLAPRSFYSTLSVSQTLRCRIWRNLSKMRLCIRQASILQLRKSLKGKQRYLTSTRKCHSQKMVNTNLRRHRGEPIRSIKLLPVSDWRFDTVLIPETDGNHEITQLQDDVL